MLIHSKFLLSRFVELSYNNQQLLGWHIAHYGQGNEQKRGGMPKDKDERCQGTEEQQEHEDAERVAR